MIIGIYKWITDDEPFEVIAASIKNNQLHTFKMTPCDKVILIDAKYKIYRAQVGMTDYSISKALELAENMTPGTFRTFAIAKRHPQIAKRHPQIKYI